MLSTPFCMSSIVKLLKNPFIIADILVPIKLHVPSLFIVSTKLLNVINTSCTKLESIFAIPSASRVSKNEFNPLDNDIPKFLNSSSFPKNAFIPATTVFINSLNEVPILPASLPFSNSPFNKLDKPLVNPVTLLFILFQSILLSPFTIKSRTLLPTSAHLPFPIMS